MAHFNNIVKDITSPIKEVTDVTVLIDIMKHHLTDAYLIYEKSIELGVQNSQEFMDWQDSLNSVSQVWKEDL